MTKETNQVKMFGVLPSHDADPIILRMAPEPAGGDMIEANKVRQIGILPSEGADPILVEVTNFDAKARAVFNPISVPPAAFFPRYDHYDWLMYGHTLQNRTSLTAQYFVASVMFSHGVTVTKVTLYGYRDDGDAVLRLILYRTHRLGGEAAMVDIVSNWTTGWSSLFSDDITFPVINNGIYSYTLFVVLSPNDNVADVKFSGAKIEFTG